MPTITWLHLSDLHFQVGDQFNRQIVLEALWRDIRTRIAEGLRPDFIVLTGDIAFHGKAEEYALAVEHFFTPLLDAAQLTKNVLFIIPGNHDVDWDAVALLSKDIPLSLIDRDKVNDFLAARNKRRLVFQSLSDYADFVRSYLPECWAQHDPAYYYIQKITVGGKHIALVGLNSAWLSGFVRSAQGNVTDHGNLLIGEQQVRDALMQTKGADIRITLVHHPFAWLKEFDAHFVEGPLRSECHFILRGHLHHPQLMREITLQGECVIIPAGAVYDRREWPNGYNFVQLDPDTGKGTVYLRRYFDERHEWMADIGATGEHRSGCFEFDLPQGLQPKFFGPAAIDTAQTLKEQLGWETEFLNVVVRRAAAYTELTLPAPLQAALAQQRLKVSRLQARIAALDSSSPLHRPRPLPNLPARKNFIGREEQKLQVRRALASRSYIVSVEGVAGIGKTALSIEVCHELWRDQVFEAMAWTAPSKGSELKLGAILDTLADVLGYPYIKHLPLEQKRTEVQGLLARQACLLVVDNFETIPAQDQEIIIRFLLELPEPSKALIITRHAIAVEANKIELKALAKDEALQLIRSEAERQGVDSVLRAKDETLLNLYEATGGAPLALVWAVAEIAQPFQTLEGVLSALYKATRGAAVDLFEFMFDRSWALLSASAQKILATMPVFAGSASRQALESICDIHEYDLDRVLTQLVKVHLLEVIRDSEQEEHFDFSHPLVRNFARARLEEYERDRIEQLERRTAEHFLQLASHFGPTGWQGYKTLEAEQENLWSVVRWCRDKEQWQEITNFMFNVRSFLDAYGYHDEVIEFGRQALAREQEASEEEKTLSRASVAWFNYLVGRALFRRGDYARAKEHIEEAYDLFVVLDDKEGLVNAMRYLAKLIVGERSGEEECEKARKMWQQGLDIAKHENYMDMVVRFMNDLGRLEFKRQRYSEAAQWHQQALEINQTLRDQEGIAFSTGCLGNIAVALGHLEEARQLYSESIELNKKYGRPVGIAHTFLGMAELEEKAGNPREAVKLAEQAKDIYTHMGMVAEIARAETLVKRLGSKD